MLTGVIDHRRGGLPAIVLVSLNKLLSFFYRPTAIDKTRVFSGRAHFYRRIFIFTALNGMQTRSSDDVRRPSVKRVNYCDKTEERSVQIFIPAERPFSLVF